MAPHSSTLAWKIPSCRLCDSVRHGARTAFPDVTADAAGTAQGAKGGAGGADMPPDGEGSAEGRLRAVCAILDGMDADGLRRVRAEIRRRLKAFRWWRRYYQRSGTAADAAGTAQSAKGGAGCANVPPDGVESAEGRLRAVCAILYGMGRGRRFRT